MTDKNVSYEQVEMLTHQITEQTSFRKGPIPSDADNPNEDIDPLPQKSNDIY